MEAIGELIQNRDLQLAGSESPADAQRDVRFIGAMPGRYVLPERKRSDEDRMDVHNCRLCSISTTLLVAIGPVVGLHGEGVCAHFDEFGILRGRIIRRLPSGFVLQLQLTTTERQTLGAKIEWRRKHVYGQLPDKRAHKRILPKDPRTVLTLGDGTSVPCSILDASQSGVAVSAPFRPDIGTPMAIGRLVGRVVRHFKGGFALKFLHMQAFEDLENLLHLSSE